MHEHEQGFALGLYDESQSAQVETLRRHCEESISNPTVTVSDASDKCLQVLLYTTQTTGGVDQMDSRYFDSDNTPNDAFQYMFTSSARLDELKKALHITKPSDFIKLNSTVAAQILDRNLNTAKVFSDLLSRGVRVLINIGEFDLRYGVRSSSEWIK